MGLREKVTITLVIIALIQIACRHCMPRTPRKASLKRNLNDLKPVKNNPVPTPYAPSRLSKKQTFGKTVQNGKISQTSLPKKSLYKTYNFPEIEYPLDNFPRDPFRIEINFNDNNHVHTLQKARNLQSSAINDLKKEMKMKRKLLSNKQVNNENSQLKTDTSPIKSTSNPDSMRLLDSEKFPEVQYPLNTMETWGQNYWSYSPFSQEKQFNGFGQQTFNSKAKEDIIKPFTRLTKAKASRFLQSYDKLKEEQRRNFTGSSKRSNAGQKGLNFTKTATCERVSDDFITVGLVSNKASNSIEIKKTSEPTTEIIPSSENTCPVTEYPYHSVPIPYRVIENNTEDICPAFELKNSTKELKDVDTSEIAQTLQLIKQILFHDDTNSTVQPSNVSKEIEIKKDVSPSEYASEAPTNEDITSVLDTTKNYTVSSTEQLSKKTEKDIYSSDYTFEAPVNEGITTVLDTTRNGTVSLTEELSQDVPAVILQNNTPSLLKEAIQENTCAVSDPLNVKIPLPFTELITNEVHLNVTNLDQTNMTPLANSNAVPGSTSIIIIPINNNFDGKSLSHLFEQIVSSSLDNSVPNNQLHNVISNIVPLRNDNPSSTALVSKLLNSISDSRSSLPIYETLPTNSMCYNHENILSSLKEKPISDILIPKSLTDDAPFVMKTCDKKLPQQPTETDMNTDTLPATPNSELFDFADSEFTSTNYGPYNNVLNNELPILTREINSDQQIPNVSSKDLFIPIKNVTSEKSHRNISKDTFSEIANAPSTVALERNFSSEIATDNLPQPIVQLPATLPITKTVEKPLPTEKSLKPTPLSNSTSEKLPDITDVKLPPAPSTTTVCTPHLLNYTSSLSPILNSSPMTTDMSLKTELIKLRQILDKLLASETPTDTQTAPMYTTLQNFSDSNNLLSLINQTTQPTQASTDSVALSVVNKTILPLLETDSIIDSLLLKEHDIFSPMPVDGTSSDTLPLPVDKSLNPSLLLDTADRPPLSTDKTVPSTLVFENFADEKPYLDNQVTPLLSETSTQNTPKNDLSRTIDDVPINSSGDNIPLTVVDLPIIVHSEHTTKPISGLSKNNLPMQVVEPQNPIADVQVTNLINPTRERSVPEMLEVISPEVLSKNQQSTNPNKTRVEELSEPTLPDIRHEDLSLTEDKMLPMTNNTPPTDLPLPINKTTLTSKLPITKTLLENILLDITKEGLSSPVAKLLPDTPPSTLDNSLYYVDEESPLSEAKKLPQVDKIFHKTTTSGDLTNSEKIDNNILVDEMHSDTPLVVIPTNLLSKMNELYTHQPDILTEDIGTQEETETLSLDNPADDFSLLTDKVSDDIDDTLGRTFLFNQKLPFSKLPITKVLLENVLTDVTTKGFSLPVSEILPVKPTSILDQTIYYLDSPLSGITERSRSLSDDKILPTTELSDHPTDNNSPFSRKSEDTLPLIVDEKLSVVSSLDIPIEMSNAEKNEVAIPVNIMHSNTPLVHIPTDLLSKINEIYKDQPEIAAEDVRTQQKTERLSLDNPTDDVLLLTDKVSPPIDNTLGKTSLFNQKLPSSKLPIAKALLESVLSSVTTKGFSLPVSKTLPVKPTSKSDKTLYYLKSPLYGITEEKPSLSVDGILPKTEHSDHTTDNNLLFLEQTEDTYISKVDEKLPEVLSLDTPIMDFPTDLLLNMDEIYTDQSDILTEDVGTQEKTETLSLDNPTDADSLLTNKVSPPIDDTLGRTSLFNQKLPSSKLPITKALLENVLADVTTKDFSLPVSKTIPVKPTLILDQTTVHGINEESPSLSVDASLHSTKYSHHSTDYNSPFSGKLEHTSSLKVDEKLSEVSSLDIPIQTSSLMDEILTNSNGDISSPIIDILPFSKDTVSDLPLLSGRTLDSHPYILTENVGTQEKSEMLSLDNPTDNVPLLTGKVSSPINDTLSRTSLCNQKLPSSKLPIAKALLENVLVDVTTKGFSLPVSKNLPVKPTSMSVKALPYLESPLSGITEERPSLSHDGILPNTEHSDHPTDNNSPFFGQPKDNLPLKVDEKLSEVSNLDIPIEMSLMDKVLPNFNDEISSPIVEIPLAKDTPSDLPSLSGKTLSSSKLPIIKTLLENVLLEFNTKGFSLPLAVESKSQLDGTLNFMDSPLSNLNEEGLLPDLSSVNFPSSEINENDFELVKEDALPLKVDEKLSEVSSLDIPIKTSSLMDEILPNSNDDISSSIVDISPIPKDTTSHLPLPSVKTLPSSKLPITKALLENVLSDINTRGLSLLVAKSLPVESRSQLDKTLYFMDFPLSDLNEESLLPDLPSVNFTSSEINEDDFELAKEDALPLKVDKKLSEISSLDIPIEKSLMNQILPNSNDEISSPIVDMHALPKDTPSNLPLLSDKTLPSSKLPITKALLENVLSEINTKGFSLPVAKPLSVEPRSQLDKTLYFMDSPLSDLNEESLLPDLPSVNFTSSEINEDDFEIAKEDALPLKVDKKLSEISSLDIPIEKSLMNQILPNSNDEISSPIVDMHALPKDTPSNLPLLSDKTLPSSKLPITKALLENVLSEINTKGFSLPVAKPLSVEPRSQLDKTLYFMDSPLSDFNEESSLPDLPNANFPSSEINEDDFKRPKEDALPLQVDEKLSEVSSVDIPTEMSLMDEILANSNDEISSSIVDIHPFPKNTPNNLPLQSEKTLPSTKLPITKALLENILSEINAKGSLAVTKSLPVEPHSQLDKILYFMESPLSDFNGKSSLPDIPHVNYSYPEINEDVFKLSTEKIFLDKPNLDMPTEDSSDNLTEEIEQEDSNETSDNPLDDTDEDELPTQTDKQLSDNMSNDLSSPKTRPIFTSTTPITKALLEQVLSNINHGDIRP